MAGAALDTYVRFGRSRARRLALLGRSGVARTCAVQADITDGPQAGSAVILDAPTFTLGSDSDDDVFVLQSTDDAGSVTVSVVPSVLGPLVTVTGPDAGVALNGVLVTATDTPERLPCEITLPGATVVLRATAEQIENRSRSRRLLPVVAIMALAGVGLLLDRPGTDAAAVRLTMMPAPVRTDAAERDALIGQARDMVESAGLGDLVDVAVDGTIVRMTGNLTSAQGGTWAALQPGLDRLLSDVTVFDGVEVTQAPSAFPAISAVVAAPRQFLLLTDGTRVGIGDNLAEGFLLDRIDGTSIHLARGDETMTLTY